jgi:hypothetical protein
MLAHHRGSAPEFATASGQPVAELAESARLAFREAGDHAAALFVPRNALRLYERALELWPLDDPERPLLLYRRVKAAHESEGAGEGHGRGARGSYCLSEPGLAAEVGACCSTSGPGIATARSRARPGGCPRRERTSHALETTVLAMRARYPARRPERGDAADWRWAIEMADSSDSTASRERSTR